MIVRPAPRDVQDPRGGIFSQSAVRQRNLTVALQLVIADDDRISRAEIARRSGLTSATVSSLLSELIALGYVEEGEPAESTGGKRAIALRVNRSVHGILVIIARPRSLRGAVLDLGGRTVKTIEQDYPGGIRPEDVADFSRTTAATTALRIMAVAIQVPGVSEGGIVIESVQLDWREVDVADLVTSSTGAPSYTVNDADAEALAEHILGSAADHVFIHVGEGIGAAIVQGGRLMRGTSNRAGEIGHVRVVFEGGREQCRCGLYGCLESTSSLTAMLGAGLTDEHDPAVVRVLAQASASHPRIAYGARALSRAVRMICAALDTVDVIVGGAAPALGTTFIDALRDELDLYQPKGARAVHVSYARNTDRFVGAAQFALDEVLGIRWVRREEPAPA